MPTDSTPTEMVVLPPMTREVVEAAKFVLGRSPEVQIPAGPEETPAQRAWDLLRAALDGEGGGEAVQRIGGKLAAEVPGKIREQVEQKRREEIVRLRSAIQKAAGELTRESTPKLLWPVADDLLAALSEPLATQPPAPEPGGEDQLAALSRDLSRMASEAQGEERQAPTEVLAAEERGRRQAFEVAVSELRRVVAEPTKEDASSVDGEGAGETLTQYRVVHGETAAIALTTPFEADRARAEHVRDSYNPVGFNEVFHNIRLQARAVTNAPWTDLPASSQTTGGEG